MGILSYHLIGWLHSEQKLLGLITDKFFGNLIITTLIKLPIETPIKKIKKISIK